MEKEDNYTAPMPPNFNEFDYSTAATAHHHHLMSNDNNMVDYMLNNPNHDHPQPLHHHQHFNTHDDNTVTSSNNHTFTAALGNYHLPPGSLDGSAMTLSNRFMAGSFADVMQFADFGPKLALNGPNDDDGEDDSNSNTAAAAVNYFLKFPVLNDHLHHQQQQQHQEDDDHQFPFSTAAETLQQQQEQFMLVLSDDGGGHDPHQQYGSYGTSDQLDQQPHLEAAGTVLSDDADGPRSDQAQPVQLNFLTQSSNNSNNNNISMAAVKGAAATTTTSTGANKNGNNNNGSNKRKRPRTVKTTEEVESQRMIHIAVERNRRKQMNEHLRVLRSLMPSSYVQRGDQASIIGGAIEFVRELEQLLQCLESQKRRRLYGDSGTGTTPPVLPINPSPSYNQPTTQSQLNFLDPNNQTNEDDDDEDQSQQQQLATAALAANNKAMLLNSNDHELDASGAVQLQQPPPVMLLGLREETAENKSCVADVEVKLLGFDALIKILSRRRPGQLISAISALQDLEFSILHTNITTIEQTVLYSFNVKVQSEQRFSADDIATSVQQIFTFIHANSNTSM